MKAKPNFLIIGNLKCGSTSLSHYISKHSKVFLDPTYEPRFLTSKLIKYPQNGPKDEELLEWIVRDEDQYDHIFEDANEPLIGENSSDLFYYIKEATPFVKEKLTDPRIILTLRNPAKRAFSAYNHLIRDRRENLNFEKALAEELKRIDNNWEAIYYYRAASLYFEKVKFILESYSNVHIVFLEDLKEDVNFELEKICAFLGIELEQAMITSTKYNKSGIVKSKRLRSQMMESQSFLRKAIRPIVRKIMSKQQREKLFNRIDSFNLKKNEINPQMYHKLMNSFAKDIKQLADLLDRNLYEIWPS